MMSIFGLGYKKLKELLKKSIHDHDDDLVYSDEDYTQYPSISNDDSDDYDYDYDFNDREKDKEIELHKAVSKGIFAQ